ncbi:tRNA dimethylallyltransferase [Tessaracoccus flavus]|nr:tRNA dimethylallyltransferase [Tessaracoccus flavus]
MPKPRWHTGGVPVPLVVLVGPTATGKSRLAVDVALALAESGQPAEIINADSMLVYRGMDIGTAKPTEAERRGVPHHLIDIAEVTERTSVAEFQTLARGVIARLRDAGTVPIVVGGSALYTRAITDHFDFPGSDDEVRARWEAELARVGPHELHRRLAEIAPESAAKIEPGNGRRTVRALEVAELTGGHRPSLPEWTYELSDVHQFGLWLDRAELDARIDGRVEQMWADGLVEEVRALLDRGLREGETAVRAIGYRQVVQFLDGELSEREAKAAVQRATRTFFRKQLGWYRRDPRITWLDATSASNVAAVLAGIGLGTTAEGEVGASIQLPQGARDPERLHHP